MNWLLKDLNDPQREAVTTTEGPLLIIAGAGSGKTRVLTRRLAYILTERKAEPHQILAVTFTNKAAAEMKERVAQLVGAGAATMNVSTFHSFCARLLRREAHVIGYDNNFTIFDSADSLSLIKSCIKELGISDAQFPPKGQLRKISDAKNQLRSPEQFAATANGYFESRTATIYSLYQKRLRECGAMDFDDLITNTVWLLTNNTEIGEKYRRFFKYLMVDEYQDTNRVQYLLLRNLLGGHDNICVVGDEDQSIYGWRGADIQNILGFEKDYPGAKIIKLEQNYRSTGAILKAASSVIKHNSQRKGKTLWTDAGDGDMIRLLLVDSAEAEATEVCTRIISGRNGSDGLSLKQTVILYRTNAQSRAFEEQFRRNNIAYQIVGGVSFYQRKEIKDLLAYLKLIANPKDDISFERVINYPKRGIGDKTVDDIAVLARKEGRSRYDIARQSAQYPELAGKYKRIEPFIEMIEKYRAQASSIPVDLLTQNLVTDISILTELLSEDPVLGQTKIENVEAFIEGTAEFARARSDGHLVEYLSEISLFTDLDQYREIDDKVTMMTIHSAKGLEYDTVYLVGLEEGLFPMQRSFDDPLQLEEERRLFYVGATRARHRLYLTSASVRHRFGEVESIPSRFIKEIPQNLLDRTDLRTRTAVQAGLPLSSNGYNSRASSSERVVKTGVHYEYDENETMKIGRLVSHPTFGRGKIIKSDGFGDSLRLEIMFSGLGVKKIMARYAKLTLVG
ncbi:MAG: UvrD-helicase domain-containing protein [candidate division Zixibacteria bacterium]|nr:UvrD-helicase domain-containing protein [candidate division Zixibacteria bacterium]